ncbi:hypothetical protein [Flavobacterium sp.]|uniref:hypothetical protein n=1 Tax=Flavobacterium sp. TaxID=239 RepID=UPI002B4B748B|nr:hypothetical protein [Flavobacterium sp.]HLF51518.1 hypothetical protein [Flavobacterium sp.]
MKRNDKSNIEEKFPKNPENLKKTVQEKPIRKTSTKKSDTLVYDEENSVWKVPEKLTGFQRPVVMKLEKIGDFIEGLYEGLQPVEYKKTGGVGAIMLLRQRDNSLKAINAGYDVQRFLHESGFGEFLGEYIKIELENFVDTSGGALAPMKQYAYYYNQELIPKLKAGRNFTMSQLPTSKFSSERLISSVSEVPKEKWEDENNS